MRDLDIRQVLHRHLALKFGSDPTALILDEFSLCCGKVRADIAVVNGELKGFEIKSDRDTLLRLRSQASVYGRIFDTVTLATGPRHIRKAKKIVPSWWGIFVANRKSDSTLELQCFRQERVNPGLDPFALIQLIWRDEALALLRIHNLHKGLQRKPRKFLWEALVKNFELSKLQEIVRTQLKARKGWRSVASRTRCGVTSQPSATSSSFHNSYVPQRIRLCIGRPS